MRFDYRAYRRVLGRVYTPKEYFTLKPTADWSLQRDLTTSSLDLTYTSKGAPYIKFGNEHWLVKGNIRIQPWDDFHLARL